MSAPAERIAVVAVHGVADQERGETARAVAALLINSPTRDVRYGDSEISDYVLSVEPVEAMRKELEPAGASAPSTAPEGATPTKKLKQSVRSDFLREGWVTSEGGQAVAVEDSLAGGTGDQGIDFNDYLLFKANRNGAAAEPYEGTRVRMTRTSTQDGKPLVQQVDVHEMYWADLSRLSGKVPRIVSELFTLLFRFSRLGRDAVDYSIRLHAAREGEAPRPWKVLSALQSGLDWAFMSLLANLFTQLLVLGSFMMAMHVIEPHVARLKDGVICGLAILAAWWCIYRFATNNLARLGVALLAALAAWGLMQLPDGHVAGLAVLGLLGLLLDAGLRIGEARFPGTRASGWTFFLLTAGLLLVHLQMRHPALGAPLAAADWIVAAMNVTEYVLLGIVAWWGCVPFVMLAWLAAGWLAAGRDAGDRRSVATGQLGLFVSITAFLMCCMVLWWMIEPGVEAAVGKMPYSAVEFVDQVRRPVPADRFLADRFSNSTITFSLIAGLLVLVLVHFAVMLVPSIFAEKRIRLGTPENLGRWLSGGYRGLELLIPVVVGLGVLVAGGAGMLQLLSRLDIPLQPEIAGYVETIKHWSTGLLRPLVFGTAGVTAVLMAMGRTISRYAPSLRIPLDVALDVDNHFREFPRQAIPRARIFFRYTALLEHLAAQGYDRIVIVAHSQGSVISAELLRYFKERTRLREQQQSAEPDRVVRLWKRLEERVDLLTAGNPLRQLYAARFPALYAWVRAGDATQEGGPADDAIGVRRWLNLYTTGDYVGRWLWARPGQLLYTPDEKLALGGAVKLDVCLGSGAHTHYFDPDQAEVAKWVDLLVAGPPAVRQQPLVQAERAAG